MARVKRTLNRTTRVRKIFRQARGYRGARSRLLRTAICAVWHGLQYQYRDRKVRKREFRSLWITRIGAATKAHGLSYSRFVGGLKRAGIDLNRKMLSQIAIEDPGAFGRLVEISRAA
ncbi:50S ribosomal protein L20 [Myxococcota bacterium]|nr:50S ribosomal protein L20 [Myxococcota bacterium]